MASTLGAQLHEKLTQPIKFQWSASGAQHPPSVVHGFDATLLIDVCNCKSFSIGLDGVCDAKFKKPKPRIYVRGFR